ncbi:MAG: type II toxin-antitoxin system RelE/ParE family toxin [Rhizomicrobium sp.]
MPSPDRIRPLDWIGSSKKDFLQFPKPVQAAFGYSLHLVQTGDHPPVAKPLKGFAGVLELTSFFDGDAYRAVYTVRFRDVVYVLHAFKKKSKRGIATPKADIDLIHRRLKQAMADHAALYGRET